MSEEKRLLKIAEEKMLQLQEENKNLSTSFYELMDGQKAEAEQMVQLTEQLWALEEALALSKEQAIVQMELMKSKIESVNEYVQDTLVAASRNASSIELAARVYEIADIAKTDDIDLQLEEYNEKLKPGKLT